jgi:hypothetical protein
MDFNAPSWIVDPVMLMAFIRHDILVWLVLLNFLNCLPSTMAQ